MRIGVTIKPYIQNAAPIAAYSVAATLSNDVHNNPQLLKAETTALQGLLNDSGFRAAAVNGVRVIGEAIFDEIVDGLAPGANEMLPGKNQYIAIVTDTIPLASILKKGDTISLLEQLGKVSAEVVEAFSSAMPNGRGVTIATTVFKVSIPLIGAWHRFEAQKDDPANLEAAVLQAQTAIMLSHLTSDSPLSSAGRLRSALYSPNSEIQKIFETHIQASRLPGTDIGGAL